MPAVDDLPKMVSLSPEPLATMDDKTSLGGKVPEPLQPTRRHNLDAEVIEALFQQDIDLGLTRHDFDPVRSPLEQLEPVPEKAARLDDEWLSSKVAGADEDAEDDTLDKIWAGLDYTIDSETGECMLLPSSAPAPAGPAEPAPVAVPTAGRLGSQEAVPAARSETLLPGPIPTTIDELMGAAPAGPPQELARRLPHCSGDSGQSSLSDSDAEIALLDRMIEAAHSTAQPRVPLNRMVSMEQRWQDLASVLLLPAGQEAPAPVGTPLRPLPTGPGALPTGHGLLPGGFIPDTGALAQPAAPLSLPSGGPPLLDDGGASGGELTYFQLSPAGVPGQAVGAAGGSPLDQDEAFLSQLLGVDQLDLSTMPITELAPQDWSSGSQGAGGGSPAQSPSGGQSQSSPSGQFGAGPGRSAGPTGGAGSDARGRSPRLPVAQKKHQMYGKRIFQSQDGAFDDSSASSDVCASPCRPTSSPAPAAHRYGTEGGLGAALPAAGAPAPPQAAAAADIAEIKYSRTPQFTRMSPAEQLDSVAHNHSYHQPASVESGSDSDRPVARDKVADKKPAERVSRDEKRLRSMEIPLTADEIVHMPMDDFNERLAKLQLSEAQLSLVRDVRRRGKNKLAAQNCRKRKLDQITSLTEDLQKVRDERQRILAEHQYLTDVRARIRDKYAQLHRHVFQSLRDADDQPYSPTEYSLQLSADGDVLLVPRGPARGAAIVPSAAVDPAARHKPRGAGQ
ncbi:segmentation protein cap'n'collar-like isoform X1 [Amphibalanus amphitrite]|uniref:segmentation protein cap'n'collar-like isoform X1 n=1 Tax=Amphibalanus amphitrite TaxID=1232801 RepID=UPI001C903816|nr:segmentation protein cap'n'collar-like isoform X1 [Amphibalanus amphitrite]